MTRAELQAIVEANAPHHTYCKVVNCEPGCKCGYSCTCKRSVRVNAIMLAINEYGAPAFALFRLATEGRISLEQLRKRLNLDKEHGDE